jgi:NADH dehydrogenase/NADH:ubiquinone oxidoreductase subunit G
MREVKIKINDVELTEPDTMTVLEAAKQVNVKIRPCAT